MKTIYIVYHCNDFWILLDKTIVGSFYSDEAECGAEEIARIATRALLAGGQEAQIFVVDRTKLVNHTMQDQDMEYDGETLVLEWLLENLPNQVFESGKLVEVHPYGKLEIMA